MRYTSNMEEVVDDVIVMLEDVRNTDPILKKIAVSLSSVIPERIHNRGVKSSGAGIGTYTPFTQEIRRRSKKISSENRAKTTDIVLSFTGKLSKEFIAAPTPNGWGLGMATTYGAELYDKFTARFGNVWEMTSTEEDKVNQIVTNEINRKLK